MTEGFLCSLSSDTSQGLPGEVVHPHCSLYSEMGFNQLNQVSFTHD